MSSHSSEVTDAARRHLLKALAGLGVGGLVFQRALAQSVSSEGQITPEMIRDAQWIAGVKLSEEEQTQVAKDVQRILANQQALLRLTIDADVSPAFAFVPSFFAVPPKTDEILRQAMYRAQASDPALDTLAGIDDPNLPFASLSLLGKGLRAKKWTSQQLTKLYLDRLQRYDPVLKCVVQLTPDLALEQANRADRELADGIDRGPLHGIPWGAKDIIAVPPFPTTWGAGPYREQIRPNAATVYERLEKSGAVLLGKLSVGTLAMGDLWHDGMTRNPWNIEEGSSGSSAGSAAATVAGLCGFAIGSETLGSIVSPTQRCCVTGLRPSFGRVSRYGCMALAWTMDKIGPICRTSEDCALVFAAIAGPDGKDPTLVDHPFHWPHRREIGLMKVGVVRDQLSKQERMVLERMKEFGASVVELNDPSSIPENALVDALSAEAATSHEEFFRSGATDSDLGKWGPTFRRAQWIRATHYLRGMRARTLLIQETEKTLRKVDFVLGSNDLTRTNLTGHPTHVVACGTQPNAIGDAPGTIKMTARYFGDADLLAVGEWIQRILPPSPLQPPLERWLKERSESASKSIDAKDNRK